MLLTGCAMPFDVDTAEDIRLHTGLGGAGASTGKPVTFYADAFEHAMRTNVVDVVVNHNRGDQDLGSTRHGLHLFTTRAGLYFYLRLPSTPFATDVYRAVAAGKIRHICACSDWTEATDNGRQIVVRRANLQSLSLLITATAHAPLTWIDIATPATESRIDAETQAAQRKALWALDARVPVSETLKPPDRAA
jgi:phage head maturation protease